jgi:hypothetical protein
MKAAVFPYCSPPFVSRLAPTHLGWDTQRQFTRRSRDPPGLKRRHFQHKKRCMENLHNTEQLIIFTDNFSDKEKSGNKGITQLNN